MSSLEANTTTKDSLERARPRQDSRPRPRTERPRPRQDSTQKTKDGKAKTTNVKTEDQDQVGEDQDYKNVKPRGQDDDQG